MNNEQNNRVWLIELRSIALVALSAILYGFLGCFGIKLLEQHFSVSSMLFWRFLIAGVWILSIELMRSKRGLLLKIFKLNISFMALIFSVVCYGMGSAFYFLASQQMGTGLAMVIFFAYPVFVVVFSWFVEKKQISKYTMLSLIAIVLGMICLSGGSAFTLSSLGILFGVIAALCYGLYIFRSKYIVNAIRSSDLTIFVCLGSALVFFIISMMEDTLMIPSSLKSWLYIGAIGIIATALPIQLLLEGLKFIHPNKVSVISVLEPVVTLIIGIIVLNEPTSTLQTVGAVIILLSAMVIQFER